MTDKVKRSGIALLEVKVEGRPWNLDEATQTGTMTLKATATVFHPKDCMMNFTRMVTAKVPGEVAVLLKVHRRMVEAMEKKVDSWRGHH